MNEPRPSLWQASNDLTTAEYQMSNLRTLFIAIKKLGGPEVEGLARLGQGIAEEWADTFSYHAELFLEEHKAQQARKGGAQ
ncbi:hypothetical protein [Pseudomonas jinjuensis]|uniref:Uncharacterized protein n=1 Tax=Pseudomonas jinjuensis TaxID=198616 RepID=A0A1H0BMG4_9PSED|nr:hypothetical protein [Pseudomonas jinjuensis]SDN46887.1 hypothetical protein SAMN05216193_103126 [Pseudomonas jinjuensis]